METTKLPPRRGSEVKCRVTGFSGIAESEIVLLNGTGQLAVRPRAGKDGKFPDAQMIDVHDLQRIGAGQEEHALPAQLTDITVGAPVHDKISGLKGVTIEKVTYLNGCVYFMFECPHDPDKPTEKPLRHYVPHMRLELAGAKPIIATPPLNLDQKEFLKDAPRSPGGPSRKMDYRK